MAETQGSGKGLTRAPASLTVQEYLLGEGNLTRPAVQLLGDVMSKEGFFYLSFAEALRAHSCLSDRLR